ncbi:hypothetical protein C7N43_32345 [Sphingobacteriales bacterium UPWRP_1]|nr:hypothetical protein BVG80_06220 [Sphingobacteriales bacterium TSM_CSM]PSJ72803.1 hypothetical protein C7N43_32345 [Sphingobacteriales bacterium UPWRP_1]
MKRNTYSNEFCKLYAGKQGITSLTMHTASNNQSIFFHIDGNGKLSYQKQSSLQRHKPEGYKRP